MNYIQAMSERHSVRSYTERPIEGETKQKLQEFVERCNAESGLRIQIVFDDPKAFDGFLAHYGKFAGVRNYIALVGKGENLEERCGYFGEKIVLFAQTLGLNTCWVGLTFSKGKTACEIDKGEKLCLVIALGYGSTQGAPHKSKSRQDVSDAKDAPEWFWHGIDAALLAPTAMNQQKFKFSVNGEKVSAKAGTGFFTKVDLGIAKCHFELGAGKKFCWA